jgi:hypothetical protein
MTAIYPAMSAVMTDVQKISKDRKVTEGPARFSFRGVDDVVNVVGPILRAHKVIVVPHEVVSVEHERYTTAKGSLMDGVTITIRWRFYAEDGSFIEASSAGQSADSGDKAVPKAHSVAYRTVLLQALCIPTDEPDSDSSQHIRGSGELRDDADQALSAAEAVSSATTVKELTEVGSRIATSSALLATTKAKLRAQYTARLAELNAAVKE